MDINWVLQTVTMVGVGIIAYFSKTTVNEIKQQIKDNALKVNVVENKMDGLEKELNELKSDLPFIYVTREDFIRTMNNVDKKLDKIYDIMLQERGK